MQHENLFETIQKLPQGKVEFVQDGDPILLHLNEIATRSRGISRQKSALATYETSAAQLSEAQLQYRKHQINRTKLDTTIKSAMTNLEENLADDFFFGAVYSSGSAQQRILLAHQIGLISKDHLDWSEVIAEKRTNILNIFIYIVKDLQQRGLALESLSIQDSAETFTARFQQLIALLQKINNYIVNNSASSHSELRDIEVALHSAVNSIYESWVKPLVVVPQFYESLLMKHALSKLLDQAKKDDAEVNREFAAASTFAEDHGYEYDSILGIFRSKLPKRAT